MSHREQNREVNEYVYEPLDSSKQQIRWLRITPGSDDPSGASTVACNFEILELSQCPAYKALSYTWGEKNPDTDMVIWIGNTLFYVHENLYHFLRTILEEDETLYWMNQISINQSAILERNHQVEFMGQIYKSALEVIVWLGPVSDDSDMAMDVINRGYPRLDTPYNINRGVSTIPNVAAQKQAIETLFRRRYWERLRIVQEIMLTRFSVVRCGGEQVRMAGP
jgi:hypothetical protein